MKKETAVDWLEHEIRVRYHSGALDLITISELKLHAKAMEKEQMLDAYNAGKDDHHHMSYAEQYYNETYGGDK
jgi:uncharacterized protein with von Willebrand factor type A (vWA) domain